MPCLMCKHAAGNPLLPLPSPQCSKQRLFQCTLNYTNHESYVSNIDILIKGFCEYNELQQNRSVCFYTSGSLSHHPAIVWMGSGHLLMGPEHSQVYWERERGGGGGGGEGGIVRNRMVMFVSQSIVLKHYTYVP